MLASTVCLVQVLEVAWKKVQTQRSVIHRCQKVTTIARSLLQLLCTRNNRIRVPRSFSSMFFFFLDHLEVTFGKSTELPIIVVLLGDEVPTDVNLIDLHIASTASTAYAIHHRISN